MDPILGDILLLPNIYIFCQSCQYKMAALSGINWHFLSTYEMKLFFLIFWSSSFLSCVTFCVFPIPPHPFDRALYMAQ